MTSTVQETNAYAMELFSLQQEIVQLKATIVMAVEQISKAITSLHDRPCQTPLNAMDTEPKQMQTTVASLNASTLDPSNHIDLPAIIRELKNKITTINNETQALFQQYLPNQSNANTPNSSVT